MMSKPIERRETGEQDLFRSRLDQMIDMTHELVRLAQTIDWRFLEERFGEVFSIPPPKAVCHDLLIGVKSMAYVMRYNNFPD